MKYVTVTRFSPPAPIRPVTAGSHVAPRKAGESKGLTRPPRRVGTTGARILSPACYSVSIVNSGAGYAGC